MLIIFFMISFSNNIYQQQRAKQQNEQLSSICMWLLISCPLLIYQLEFTPLGVIRVKNYIEKPRGFVPIF